MTFDTLTNERAGLALLVLLGAGLLMAVTLLPAFPIDETRYLTVAWEMRVSGNWSLLTLNFEPYSHKPPLLFWLINASWSLFGVGVWQARLVGGAATAVTLFLVHRLERELTAERSPGPATSALLLAGLPLFLGLGFSIMFDMLLTATVAGAMLALWIAGRSGGWRAFAAYGACVGLGILAKGPVALLFTLPAALLSVYWIDPTQRAGWYRRVALSLSLALFMGLSWALRAAYLGGPEFAEMLLWKQSAGRVASSFAHARPFWFYAPILLLLFAPLLVWRPLWTGLRSSLVSAFEPAQRFLLCCIAPAIAGLSLISGKQLHYLLPVVPAIALLISLRLREIEPRPSDRLAWLAISCLLPILLALASEFAARDGLWVNTDNGVVPAIASTLDVPVVLLSGALAVLVLFVWGTTLRGMLVGLAAANLILLTSVALQSREILTRLFDLQPVADVIGPQRDHPVAVAQPSRGELGFLARLEKPVVYVPVEDIACWLARNPSGLAIVHDKLGSGEPSANATGGTILYRKDYRSSQVISVVTAAPALAVVRSETRASRPCG